MYWSTSQGNCKRSYRLFDWQMILSAGVRESGPSDGAT